MFKQDKSYTLKFVPDDGGTIHTIRLTDKIIRYVSGASVVVLLLFLAAIGMSTYILLQDRSEKEELQTLRQTTRQQQEELGNLAKRANAMQQELKDLSREEEKLRTYWGADPQTAPEHTDTPIHNGQGGPDIRPTTGMLIASMDDIENRAAMRRSSLINLHDYIKSLGMFVRSGNTTDPSGFPSTGDISSPYGLRWGGTDFHPGIDIADDYGTPIHATADGIVTFAGWGDGYGNMVDIEHAGGISTRYGHAEALTVQVGQTVKKGQIIAYMGSTGRSTGPHLHYEVRIHGEPVNPISYMR